MVVDTGIFIEYLRSKDKSVTVLKSLSKNATLLTTSVSVYELMMGATSEEKAGYIKKLLDDVIVIPFDENAAIKASQIYNQLKKRNQLIEFRDIFIAAICVINQLPLLTLNKKHFARVEDLLIL
jgi:tRNA(fMet)-specific endonuclease VapC